MEGGSSFEKSAFNKEGAVHCSKGKLMSSN